LIDSDAGRSGRRDQKFDGLETNLFVQAAHSEANSVAPVSSATGVGAIYTANSAAGTERSRDQLRMAVDIHRSHCGNADSVLLDQNEYAGKGRRSASEPLDPAWIDEQLELGLPLALTDSGYVDPASPDDVLSLLENSANLPQQDTNRVLTTLPIASKMLSDKKSLTRLTSALHTFEIPVGLVLQHSGDPFSSKAAVAGLLSLINPSLNVSLLRSDFSAVGALAAGASLGAIGTRSSLRHLYPATGGGSRRDPDDFSIVWPRGMAFYRASTLAEAIAFDRYSPQWNCLCEHCYGRSIEGIVTSDRAYKHNLSVGREILNNTGSLGSWIEKCGHAQNVIMTASSESGLRLGVPDYLGAWWAAGQAHTAAALV
jgi:hypothetical protein